MKNNGTSQDENPYLYPSQQASKMQEEQRKLEERYRKQQEINEEMKKRERREITPTSPRERRPSSKAALVAETGARDDELNATINAKVETASHEVSPFVDADKEKELSRKRERPTEGEEERWIQKFLKMEYPDKIEDAGRRTATWGQRLHRILSEEPDDLKDEREELAPLVPADVYYRTRQEASNQGRSPQR